MSNDKDNENKKVEIKEEKEISPEVLLEVIDTYIEIREYEKALCDLQDLHSFYEKSSKGSNDKILFHLKNTIKIVSDLIGQDMSREVLVEEVSEEPLMLFNLACLYAILKQKTRATRALNKAIALNPLIKDMASEEKSLRNIF